LQAGTKVSHNSIGPEPGKPRSDLVEWDMIIRQCALNNAARWAAKYLAAELSTSR
jgi:hypothetical protein